MTNIKATIIDGVTETNGEYWDDYVTDGSNFPSLRFEFEPPKNKFRNKILKTIYADTTKDKKKSFVRNISKKAIERGEGSFIANAFDDDYVFAQNEVYELSTRLYRQFIGLYYYDSEGKPINLVGFSSMPGMTVYDPDDAKKVIFNDVFLTGKPYAPGLKTGDLEMENKLYNIFLDRFDDIALNVSNDDEIHMEFITQKLELFDILSNHGYDISDSPDLDRGFYRFSKTLVREKRNNEWNNSR